MSEIEPAYRYEASVLEVTDGDTYELEVDLGFYTTRRIVLRLRGLDTPETHFVDHDSEEYELGMAVKREVEEFVEDADPLLVKTVDPDDVEEEDVKGKYGRWLGDLIDGSNGEQLSDVVREMEGVEEVDYD